MPKASFRLEAAKPKQKTAAELITDALTWLWILEPKETSSRIDLSWAGTFAEMVVALDGVELARVKSPETLGPGANFRLPDRSNLRVTLRGKQLIVTRNGRPLQTVSSPEFAVRLGVDFLYLAALWYGVPGLIFLALRNNDLGLGGVNIFTGLVFAALGYLSSRNGLALWLGIAAILTRTLLNLYTLTAVKVSPDSQAFTLAVGASVSTMLFALIILVPVVRGAIAATRLRMRPNSSIPPASHTPVL